MPARFSLLPSGFFPWLRAIPEARLDSDPVVSVMIPPRDFMECQKMKNTFGAQVLTRLAIPLVLVSAAVLPQTASAIPLVVSEFNSLYVGVDGTVSTAVSGVETYDFVGLGIRSTDPGLTGNAPFGGNPDGTLGVAGGATLNLNYRPATIGAPAFRPLDNSVLVGGALNSSGTLNVNGGSVNAPMLFAGQADNARPSSGTVNITSGGQFNATLDSGPAGPIPGFPAVNIGRGLGSTGNVTVSGAGSQLNAAAGMISVGREGTGSLSVLGGGTVTAGNTVFLSTVSGTGSSSVLVQGAGSKLDAGSSDILTGIAIDKSSAVTHGTAELNVRDGGEVKGNVFLGAGGTLKGDGLIIGNVSNSGGIVSPGNSPGTLHINGNYSQNGGVLVIEIAGPSVFDMLDVTGTAVLDNVLIRFTFTGGYGPSAGDQFDFFKASAINFIAPSFEIVGLQNGFQYGVSDVNGILSLNARSDGTPLPEPYTLLLTSLGLLMIAVFRARRGQE